MTVIIVHPARIMSHCRLAVAAGLIGFYSLCCILWGVFFLTLFLYPFRNTFASDNQVFVWIQIGQALAIWILLPLMILFRYRDEFPGIARVIVAASAYGVGAGFLPFLVLLTFVGRFAIILWCAEILLAIVLACLCWYLRWRRFEFVLADGKLRCPACKYQLVGNERLRCPECGRPFSYAELGVSAEEFRRNQAWAIARPDLGT